MFMADLVKVISALSLQLQKQALTPQHFLQALETALLGLHELAAGPGEKLAEFDRETEEGTYRGVQLTNVERPIDANYRGVVEQVINHVSYRLEPHSHEQATLQAMSMFDITNWAQVAGACRPCHVWQQFTANSY